MPDYGRIDETVEPEPGPEPVGLEEGDLHMLDACEPVVATAVGGGEEGDAEDDSDSDLTAE